MLPSPENNANNYTLLPPYNHVTHTVPVPIRPFFKPLPEQLSAPVSAFINPTKGEVLLQEQQNIDPTSEASTTLNDRLRLKTPPSLLDLPPEIRRKILGYCLKFNQTAVVTRESWSRKHSEEEYEWLTASSFPRTMDYRFAFSTGGQTVVKTNFHVSVLRVCKKLCREGLTILRRDNKWVGVEGLELYPSIKQVLSHFGDFPFWRMARMQMQKIRVQGVWDQGLPDINIVARVTDLTNYPCNDAMMFVFPVSYLKHVCFAIQHLPSAEISSLGDPLPGLTLQLAFPHGLLPKFLGQEKGQRHTSAFFKTLSRDIIKPLGKWVVTLDIEQRVISRDGDQSLRCVENCFVNEVTRCLMEEPETALRTALRELVTALQEGDRLALARHDLDVARNHFLAAKRLVCTIYSDPLWPGFISESDRDALQFASDWACYRVATLPIANEKYQMQAHYPVPDKAVDQAQALFMLTHTAQGGTWPLCDFVSFLSTPSRSKMYAHLHLRKAELGYMAGLPHYHNARPLFQACLWLAPTALYSGSEHDEATVDVLQWVFDFLYTTPTQGKWYFMPSADRFDLILGMGHIESADEDYWKQSWNRMRGRMDDDEKLDRECFIERWAEVKAEVEERFGKVEVSPIDFEGLFFGPDVDEY